MNTQKRKHRTQENEIKNLKKTMSKSHASQGAGTGPEFPSDKYHGYINGLSSYMGKIGHYSLLSSEKQLELARRYQEKGDEEAGSMLIYSNLRLVVKIASKYQSYWKNHNLDLIQEGNVGLMKAIHKFDPDRKIKFSYYASFWIKAYILKYIMDNWRMVRIGTSHNQRNLFFNLSKEKQRLEFLGIEPDSRTISRNLDIPEPEVEKMTQMLSHYDVSLNMQSHDNSDDSVGDTLPSSDPGVEESFSRKETSLFLKHKIHELMHDLNHRERDIVRLRLIADYPFTLGKIGQKYDISRERVRQIESKLLGKIKDYMESEVDDFSRDWLHSA